MSRNTRFGVLLIVVAISSRTGMYILLLFESPSARKFANKDILPTESPEIRGMRARKQKKKKLTSA